MKRMIVMMGTVLVLLSSAGPLHAHRVNVFAWLEDGTIYTESKFSGGKWVHQGKIEVFDGNQRKLLEGTTDSNGRFAFPKPEQVEALTIVLTAGMGHGARWEMGPEELGGSPPAPVAPATPGDTEKGDQTHPHSIQEIEEAVARAVQKALVAADARKAERAWNFRDIVAGFGYIAGIVGLASYLRQRKTASARNRQGQRDGQRDD